jgi:TonB-linked SusC/RagA family outer membrane protein
MELNCFCGKGRAIALITRSQNFLIMKLTAFFMIIGCLQLSAAGISQTVTIKVEKAPLEKVFEMVEQQTDFMFFYEKKLLLWSKPVTIDVSNVALTTFLDLLFREEPLAYSIRNTTITVNRKSVSNNRIILRENNPEEISFMRVSGKVLSTEGTPLAGASIVRLGRKSFTISDQKGSFSIEAELGDTLLVSYVAHETVRWKVTGPEAKIVLKPSNNKMENVEVTINTGYQRFKANEMVGSVEVITEKMLQERVGTSILDRLQGLTTGLQFQTKTGPSKASGNPRSVLNMSIRGWNTINGPTDPLIIVDNFPYTGDIDNINPNDVESINLLKDAAATSIWGAKAGNGVIVINLKKGRFNQKTSISFSSTVSYSDKPRLNRLPLMTSAEYIDQEIEFSGPYASGVWDGSSLSPALEVLRERFAGKITAEDSAAKIDYLKSIDSREQWDKYIYVHPLEQSYSLSMQGGGSNIAWNVSGSHARSRTNTRDMSSRTTFNFGNTFRVSPIFDIILAGSYATNENKSGARGFNVEPVPLASSSKYYPYLQLNDEAGNPVPIAAKGSKTFLDTLGGGLFLDYFYYPGEDWKHKYSEVKSKAYDFRASLLFRPVKGLSTRVELSALNQQTEDKDMADQESYYTRDIINQFTQLNRTTMVANRLVPLGDIVKFRNNRVTNLNVRSVAEYEKKFGDRHLIRIMGLFDLSRVIHRGDGSMLFGYSEDPLMHTLVDFQNTLVQLPNFSTGNSLANVVGSQNIYTRTMLEERMISTALSFSYEYNKRYLVSGSLRRDGANILGVRTNDRWKPLWNIGARWAVSKEPFFNVKWISTLNIHSSIGLSGNVDITRTSDPVAQLAIATPFPYLQVATPPNPELRWEKNLQANWKLDLGLLANRITLTLDYYIKRNRDLYGRIGADFTQSPASTVTGNVSSMDGSGWELQMKTHNFVGKFNWSTTFNWTRQQNNIRRNYIQPSLLSILNIGDGQEVKDFTVLFQDQSLYAINAIRTGGLDAEGRMIYLVDGKPTINQDDMHNDIRKNGKNASSLKFFGSSEPVFRSSVINYFSWKQFSLSFQLQFNLGYYVRKKNLSSDPGSYHKDWTKRWKKPGDELHTIVPKWDNALVAPNYAYFNYPMMDINVVRGDHIRFSNLQLNYSVPMKSKGSGMKSLNIAFNADSFGVIWRANKELTDPESTSYMTYGLEDKRWSLTIAAGF